MTTITTHIQYQPSVGAPPIPVEVTIDEEDVPIVQPHKWKVIERFTGMNRARKIKVCITEIDGREEEMQRMLYRRLRPGEFRLITHINGNGCDNRKMNHHVDMQPIGPGYHEDPDVEPSATDTGYVPFDGDYTAMLDELDVIHPDL